VGRGAPPSAEGLERFNKRLARAVADPECDLLGGVCHDGGRVTQVVALEDGHNPAEIALPDLECGPELLGEERREQGLSFDVERDRLSVAPASSAIGSPRVVSATELLGSTMKRTRSATLRVAASFRRRTLADIFGGPSS
jgi:hypothetical protein